MIRISSLTLAFFLLITPAAPGNAGYRELVGDWQSYSPPGMETPGTRSVETSGRQSSEPSDSGRTDSSIDLDALYRELAGQGRFYADDIDGIRAAASGGGHGQEGSGYEVTDLASNFSVDRLEALVLDRNPAIKSAAAALLAELDGFGQAADLDALLSRYAAFTKASGTGVGPMTSMKNGGAAFPFPGPAGLKSRVVLENAVMASESLAMTRRDSLIRAGKTFWNLWYIHERTGILTETLDLYQQLHDVASTLYRSGKTGFQDVIRITVRVRLLEDDLASLAEKRQAIEASIRALADLPAGTRIGNPHPGPLPGPVPGVDDLVETAMTARQELRRQRSQILKMDLMIEMAESMTLPGLASMASRRSDADIRTAGTWSSEPAFKPTAMASMGPLLPRKPWFGASESWLAQTRKKRAAMAESLRDMENQTVAAIRDAWARLDDARRARALLESEILDLTASALDASRGAYEAGLITFADTAGAYREWFDARLSKAAAVRDIGLARADLLQLVGRSF